MHPPGVACGDSLLISLLLSRAAIVKLCTFLTVISDFFYRLEDRSGFVIERRRLLRRGDIYDP